MYSLICMLGYVKTNIVTYRICSDAQLVSLCLTGTLSSKKSDNHMLAYIISSSFFLTLLVTSPQMGTGVSAPEALVLISARNDLFCCNRIGWRRGCVSGMSGECQCGANSLSSAPNQRRNATKLNTPSSNFRGRMVQSAKFFHGQMSQE